MMFLPLEKLPIFVWGIILVFIMGFLALQEDLFSSQQAIDVGVAMLGIGAVVFDLRKRLFPSTIDTPAKT